MYAVDPRRTSSAQWAAWLGIDVGSGISLANAIAQEIIQAAWPTRRSSTGPPPATSVTIRAASCATSASRPAARTPRTPSRSRWPAGFDARISTEFDVGLPDSACVYCGNCIGVCPTGALMFKSEHDMRQDGSWDESRQAVTTTICPYCGVGCNLDLHVQDNRIVKVTSPLDHDVGHGHLCVKGRFGFEFVQRRAGES